MLREKKTARSGVRTVLKKLYVSGAQPSLEAFVPAGAE